jgi:hypothetical protein
MQRLARTLALVAAAAAAAAACGSRRVPGKGDGTVAEPAAPPPPAATRPAKQAIFAFAAELSGVRTKVWLTLTDEIGGAISVPIDELDPAECSAEAGGEMSALGTLRCAGHQGRQIVPAASYLAVARAGEMIVLGRRPLEDGEWGEYVELRRVAIPQGAAVTFVP